jgi:hypothetical protein
MIANVLAVYVFCLSVCVAYELDIATGVPGY